MNSKAPLKRHPALRDLSRDHQRLLLEARNIRWSVEGSPHAQPLAVVAQSLSAYWQSDGLPHLREEEELLIPLYPVEFSEDIEQLKSDHAWLRANLAKLAATDPPESVLMEQIGGRLHDHVRFEERVIFERLQATLSQADLIALGEQSLAFRKQWRTPDAIGPYRR